MPSAPTRATGNYCSMKEKKFCSEVFGVYFTGWSCGWDRKGKSMRGMIVSGLEAGTWVG